jgi:hypothetical protein
MECNFKKTEAKFKFSKNWTGIDDKTQKATIDLIINYHNKTFSVTPDNQVSGKFTFCQGGVNSAIMWHTVLELIQEATNFAYKELFQQ